LSDRLDTLARRLVDARRVKDETAAAEKKAKEAYAEIEAEFWQTVDDMGVKTVTLDLGEGYGKAQFQRRETITASAFNPEAAERAIKAMGLEDELLGPRATRQKVLSEYVRDWLASGQELPEGVEPRVRRYISIGFKGE
jgi:hypothetical protein